VSDYTPNVTTSDISILGSDEIETLKSNIKNYLDSVVYIPDLLPVINPVMAAGPNDCPIITPTANIAMYSRYECATEDRQALKQYVMDFSISYNSIVGGYVRGYTVVDVYNDIHSELVTPLTEAVLLSKTPTEYLDIVEEVYNALSTYHTNSHLFAFEPFDSTNFVINAGSECVHTYTVEYEYECLLRNHEHWGVGKTGSKIAKTITVTDTTVPAEWTINIEDYLLELDQNVFPFTGLPEGYTTDDEFKFLNSDQIATVKMHVYNAIQLLIGSYGMPQIDLNNNFSLSDSSCNDITYEVDFGSRCRVRVVYLDDDDTSTAYFVYTGKKVVPTVVVRIFTNGIWTSSEGVPMNDMNPYTYSGAGSAYYNVLQFLTDEQLAVVKNNIVNYLSTIILDAGQIPEFDMTWEDGGCETVLPAYVDDYSIPKCAVPAQGVKYATEISIRYDNESSTYGSHNRIYNIVDYYNIFNPLLLVALTEEDLLSMTQSDYLEVVESVYEGLQTYHANSHLFTFAPFSTEGVLYDAITTDSECDEPGINTETVAYYCHEVEKWLYDSTKLLDTYAIMRTSDSFVGRLGLAKVLLSDVQGSIDGYSIYKALELPTTNDNWLYSSQWANPTVQVNGKNHIGFNETSRRVYYPVISISGLTQAYKTGATLRTTLCIPTSKNYAFCCNADDNFDIYIDDVKIAYKTGVDSGEHWLMYAFEVYISEGNHILKFEFADKGTVAFGAVLEIYDDIDVLFAQYDTRAEKLAAFNQHRILSTLDYMYDVYTDEPNFTTRAYGLVPFYKLSTQDINSGWKLVADPYECHVIAAKKQIVGYSGFRIANHILWNNNGTLTAAINSSIYPGKTAGDIVTVDEDDYTVTTIFDVPLDLIDNKEYYKTHPVLINTVPVVYYDVTHSDCDDNAVISNFRWEDYSGQTGEIEVEAFDVDEVEAENVDVLILRSNIISGQTDTDGNHSQVDFSVSYPNGISNPSSVFVEDLNTGMIRVTKNETSSPRKDLIKYTQAGTGEELYLSIIQWGNDSAPAVIYTLSELLNTITLPCFTKKVVIDVISHLNGRYHPITITNNPTYLDTYLDSYEINRKQGSFDTAEVVLYLKQNLTNTSKTFALTFEQDNSGNTVTQTIIQKDCRNTKDVLDVRVKRAYHHEPNNSENTYPNSVYVVGGYSSNNCKFTILIEIEAYNAEGDSVSDSATVQVVNDTGSGVTMMHQNVNTVNNVRTVEFWIDGDNTTGINTLNHIIISYGTESKVLGVIILTPDSTTYDGVSPCFE
jgi:hypothetical protein